MRLRARSGVLAGQVLTASFRQPEGADRFPVLCVEGGLVLSLEAALLTYEMIEATPQERRILQQWGHPFGGVQ
jgi:hypothetical protein